MEKKPDRKGMVIAGRSVTNYILCGKPVPDDSVLVPCSICGDVLALSAKAALRVNQGAYAMCSVCVAKLVDKSPPGFIRAETTERGAKQQAVTEFLKAKGLL
jgi:hypothetical protein